MLFFPRLFLLFSFSLLLAPLGQGGANGDSQETLSRGDKQSGTRENHRKRSLPKPATGIIIGGPRN